MSEEKKEEQPNSELDAWKQNMNVMLQIVDFMKADTVREREKKEREAESKDTSRLLKVEFPKEGGIKTYMEGHDQPYLGFPYTDFVAAIDGAKKLTKYFFQRLHYIVTHIPPTEIENVVRNNWLYQQLIAALFYSLYRVIERWLIKPELYCRPVREIRRVLTEMAPLAKIDRDENRILQVRDVLCMYMEFDNAYRFRFQDMFEELNKEAAVKNPAEEIKRLYEISISREKFAEVKEKQSQYKDFFYYLFKIPRNAELASEFFKRLNIEEVRLSEIDKHWCKPRIDYTFGFFAKEQKVIKK